MSITEFELGWLVGILEGEGCFMFDPHHKHAVDVRMVDEDTVNRVASLYERILGKSVRVLCYAASQPNRQDVYVVKIHGENARVVMRLVVRHMGYRRRQKIWQCLNDFNPQKVDLATVLQLRPKDPAA